MMDFDEAISAAGGFAKFHIVLISSCYHLNTLFGSQMYLMTVIGAHSDETKRNHSTLVSEWEITDDDLSFISGLFVAGVALGAVVFGQLADIYGRKPVLIINFVLMTSFLLASAFAPSEQVFLGERFVTGLFFGGAMIANFVLMYEFTEKNHAATVAILYLLFFAVGVMQVALLGFLLPTWRLVVIVLSAFGAGVPFSFYFLIPESARWLYSIGNVEKAQQILQKIAEKNKMDQSVIRLREDINRYDMFRVHTLTGLSNMGCLRKRLATAVLVWIGVSVMYYGIPVDTPGINIGFYSKVAMSGAVEIPVYLTVLFQIEAKLFGRKGTVMSWLLLCCSACIAIIFLKAAIIAPVMTTLQMIGKLGATGAFCLMYLYVSEMVPTQVRCASLGVVTLASSAAVYVAFYTFYFLEDVALYLPYIGLTSVGVISGGIALFLPETMGCPFPTMSAITNQPRFVYPEVETSSEEDFPINE